MGDLQLKRKPNGKRYVTFEAPADKATGKRNRHYHEFADELTDEECLVEAAEWQDGLTRDGRTTLEDALIAYIEVCESVGKASNTIRIYNTYLGYIGRLGRVAVEDVSSKDLDALYDMLLRRGGKHHEGLSRNTVRGLHRFMSRAWAWIAKRYELTTLNPTVDVERINPEQHEVTVFDEDEIPILVQKIAEWIAGNQSQSRRCAAMAAYISLFTGMRCGEVCALTRRDISFVKGEIHIHANISEAKGQIKVGKTKSKKSRNIAMAEDLAEHLRQWYAFAPAGVTPAGGTPASAVITVDGSYMRPSAISRDFTALCREAKLPAGKTFHTLRHTHATYLLSSGFDIKTVSERLGHADVATTLRIYSHVLPGRDKQAAYGFSQIIEDLGGEQ